jgi:hypothetical protein
MKDSREEHAADDDVAMQQSSSFRAGKALTCAGPAWRCRHDPP